MGRNLDQMVDDQRNPIPSPEELVHALKQGDSAALATLYELYSDRIYSYCISVCRNQEWAADAMQDTFMLAFARISQLRDPSKLRPWLYAVARNECLRQLRVHRREADLESAGEVVDMSNTADTTADLDAADARAIIDDAFVGMNTNDRDVLDLALRQDLDNSSIASILKVSENNASAKVSRAKSQLETAVGALLLFRSRGANCVQLRESLGSETQFNVLSRKRIARHAAECDECSHTRRKAIAAIAMAGLPILAAPAWIKSTLFDAPGAVPAAGGNFTASDQNSLAIPGTEHGSPDGSAASSDVPTGSGQPSYVSIPSGPGDAMSVSDRAAKIDRNRPAFDKQGWPKSPVKTKPKLPLAAAGVALVALMGSALVLAVSGGSQGETVPDAVTSVAVPSASQSAAKAPASKKPKVTASPSNSASPSASNPASSPPASEPGEPASSGGGKAPAPQAPPPAPKSTPSPPKTSAPEPVPGGPAPHAPHAPGGPGDLSGPVGPIPG